MIIKQKHNKQNTNYTPENHKFNSNLNKPTNKIQKT